MAIAYYLSHPQVRINPAVAVPDWGLSELGRSRIAAIVRRGWLSRIERIVASGERKAIETADLTGAALGVTVEVDETMHENDRSATGFLPPAEFEATADAFFATPELSVRGWERAVDAQARIVAAATRTLAERAVDTLLVGHGGVGTLLACAINRVAIARRYDQGAAGGNPGGGNVHAFALDLSRACFGWTAMEELA